MSKKVMAIGLVVAIALVVAPAPAMWAEALASVETQTDGPVSVRGASDVDELVLLTRAAPPEIAADTLIQLATSRSTRLPAPQRLRLLEEAWALADNAQEPLKRHLVPGVDPNSRAGWLSRAFLLDLDRLSLKSRVLMALVDENPELARNNFQTIALDIPPLACRDELAYDVEAYYQAAALIAQKGFTKAERAEGAHMALLENVIYGMRSPSQVPPIARMLVELSSRDELAHLAGVFALMLREVQGDDRAFSYAMSWQPARTAIEDLALEVKARGLQADGLVDAYRTYLVRHMSQRRCASADGGALPGEDMVQRFNTTLRHAGYASASEIPPITEAESRPFRLDYGERQAESGLASIARQINLDLDHASRRQGIQMRRVRQGFQIRGRATMGRPIILSPTMTIPPPDIDQFLLVSALKDRLAIWRAGPRDDQEEYFQLKSGLYGSLVMLIPEGPVSDEILSDYVHLLAYHDTDRCSRVGWYLRVHDLLQSVEFWGPEMVDRVHSHFIFSGHPTLKAIIALRIALDRAHG